MASLIGSSKTLQPIRPFLSFLCGTDNLEGTWEHKASVTLPHVEVRYNPVFQITDYFNILTRVNYCFRKLSVTHLKFLNSYIMR